MNTFGLQWISSSEFTRAMVEIKDPHIRASAWSTMSRINTLYMIMRAGSGHLGSSFSAADIVTWLLLEEMKNPFDANGDLYFSSKGHDAPGLYAALIASDLLPERELHHLRRIDGLPGHPDVHTPHMPFCTGSLGMGISKAKGLILANRLHENSQRVFVMTGDGELQEGQNWEALRGAVHSQMHELTVIVDHNKLQSDTWVRDVNDLGDLESRFAASGWGVIRCDGHSFQGVDDAFKQRWEQFPSLPVVIIADTIKGYGASIFESTSMPMNQSMYQYHSGAPSAADYNSAHSEMVTKADEIFQSTDLAPLQLNTVQWTQPDRPAGISLTVAYGRALTEVASIRSEIVALDADLILDTGIIPFKEAHPDRFFECGIAEQDMVSMASGFARQGFLPFVHSFSCFLHSRPNEQIFNNATERRKVVYTASLAGLIPASPGHSHQAVRDISAVGGVPGLVVLEPATVDQTQAAVTFCVETDLSVYLRLVSTPPSIELTRIDSGPLILGVGEVIRHGGRTVAIGAGPIILAELLRAAEILAPELDLTVVNLPWLNRVDHDWLSLLAAEADDIVVVDNHYVHGGQGSAVADALLDLKLSKTPMPKLHRVGLGRDEIAKCGTQDEVLRVHGLHSEQLAQYISSLTPAPIA